MVDEAVSTCQAELHRAFQEHGLIKKRKFNDRVKGHQAMSYNAPPQLRAARHLARQAQQSYAKAMKNHECPNLVKSLKGKWNALSAQCRKLSKAARA
eukprot:4398748-Karenia_brevis.AAC.1